MADEERVGEVLHRADSLVKQLDETVGELIQLLREYSENQEETSNAR